MNDEPDHELPVCLGMSDAAGASSLQCLHPKLCSSDQTKQPQCFRTRQLLIPERTRLSSCRMVTKCLELPSKSVQRMGNTARQSTKSMSERWRVDTRTSTYHKSKKSISAGAFGCTVANSTVHLLFLTGFGHMQNDYTCCGMICSLLRNWARWVDSEPMKRDTQS